MSDRFSRRYFFYGALLAGLSRAAVTSDAPLSSPFAALNTTATNTGFGQITSQSNRPRMMQLAARFVF